MSERKVLNKYYPPDFDPSKLERLKRPRDAEEPIRFMLPLTIRCDGCGEYMYAGRKFNARKVTAPADLSYLGLRVFRFLFKCTACAATVSVRTDPAAADYVVEAGATRNFQPWKEEAAEAAADAAAAAAAADADAMTALEAKTAGAAALMERLDAIDALRERRERQAEAGVHGRLLAAALSRGAGVAAAAAAASAAGGEVCIINVH